MITIEIENPTEVAARQSFWARTFGALAPGFVQRKVEEKVVASLHEIFEDHGIRARITIHSASTGASWET
jgi:hypothetical protein